MKSIKLFILLICLSLTAAGQVTLTKWQNGVVTGEMSSTHQVAWVDPGAPGENRIWDFSSLDVTGHTSLYGVLPDSDGAGRTLPGNLVFAEEGYDYRYLQNDREMSELGYVNAAKNMVAEYSDPIRRMVYPFTYGDSFSDPFAGIAWQEKTSRIDITGSITYSADATGILILPDRILKNVLRVRSDKRSVQIGVCGSNQVNVTRYVWYAPGYRYPVMMVSSTDVIRGDGEPKTTRVAWVASLPQSTGTSTTGTTGASVGASDDHAVMVYPNPFSDQLSYTYFLRHTTPVRVELYDISGRMNVQVEPRQQQDEGMHSGVLRATVASLTPGVYYLRFTFGNNVVVSKIVKY